MKKAARIVVLSLGIFCVGCQPQVQVSAPPSPDTSARSLSETGAETRNGQWFAAVQRGDTEAVNALLASGTPIETRHPYDGRTALLFAAVQKHRQMVEKLLQKGADQNAKDDDGVTALMWAAFAGSPEIVKMLRAAGAKTETKDNFGKTALDWGKDHPDIVAILKKTAHK